jgi:hypothetical protein
LDVECLWELRTGLAEEELSSEAWERLLSWLDLLSTFTLTCRLYTSLASRTGTVISLMKRSVAASCLLSGGFFLTRLPQQQLHESSSSIVVVGLAVIGGMAVIVPHGLSLWTHIRYMPPIIARVNVRPRSIRLHILPWDVWV